VFSAMLVVLDLDIFAGFLLLIESVVVLMLFFLIIYINPNVKKPAATNKFKSYLLFVIFLSLVVSFTYVNLGEYFFLNIPVADYFLEDYYSALNEINTNDLSGIFVNFY